jgi:predicted kinase
MSSPKQRVYVLVGLPAAGKSTWLAERGVAALSSDAMRFLLRDDEADQTIHGVVFAELRRLLRRRLELGAAASYIDATNLTRKERRQWIKIADWYGAECVALYFAVPLAVCLERNAARQRVVPVEAMERLAKRLVPPELTEGFAAIEVVPTLREP